MKVISPDKTNVIPIIFKTASLITAAEETDNLGSLISLIPIAGFNFALYVNIFHIRINIMLIAKNDSNHKNHSFLANSIMKPRIKIIPAKIE